MGEKQHKKCAPQKMCAAKNECALFVTFTVFVRRVGTESRAQQVTTPSSAASQIAMSLAQAAIAQQVSSIHTKQLSTPESRLKCSIFHLSLNVHTQKKLLISDVTKMAENISGRMVGFTLKVHSHLASMSMFVSSLVSHFALSQ